ncbi:molecular chaperone TorD family protein [Saliphagus infecundisoli]|uniref:Molecular chaperone TorD family protein n=1 Tax=Saliphagus infecundisoli TaxID=1849069 RepID=A0ABD5QLB7_9EURY|nr:molecular chaperone TorD family protein [Saliphagus infecundisoli]
MAAHDEDERTETAAKAGDHVDVTAISGDINVDPGARGAVYAHLARLFTEADSDLYRALAGGDVTDEFEQLLDRCALDVEPPDFTVTEDREDLSARYNDLFVVGYSEVVDKTDGTVHNEGPPVSLYESDYRPDVSWNDVNLDLARAYEYFGCQVDQEVRRNHDHLRLELEFMGYLCRREAVVDPDIAAARLDFHDRHLRVFSEGLTERLGTEPGTGFYGRLGSFLDRFTASDVADLADRREGNS